MDIMNRILILLDKKGLKQADLCKCLGIKYSVFTTWKTRGTDPPTKYIIRICDFLDVSPDYLLKGEESIPTTHIENSNVGAVGSNSSGTVTINSHSEPHNSAVSVEVEVSEEITRILSSLPLRERTKLLTMIYDFEEEHLKRSTK